MYIRIYKEKKSATQSSAPGGKWILEVVPSLSHSFIDNTMDWNATKDTHKQIKLKFDSYQSAIDYAESQGMEVIDHGVNSTSDKKIKKNYLNNF
jgi:hypothetical protein